MHNETFHQTTYNGTKAFVQQDVQTANATGFGAAADDYSERGIDLNEQLIMNKPATYFFKMNSDAMIDAGIAVGDILIVDRSIKASNGKIIIATVDGELFVRRFQQNGQHYWLEAANKRYNNILLNDVTNYGSWGVVTCCIHLIDAALINYNSPKKNAIKK
ncbi:MAG: LexA family protein [Chitinophagaceae bacterium]